VVDQVAIVTLDSPSGAGTLDFTSPDITETVKAVIFLYAATLTDGSTTTHGCLGSSMWADDGESNSPGTEFFQSHFFRCLNASTSDCRGFKSQSLLQTIERDSTPANDMQADTVTAIAGGVQLNFPVVTSRSRITAILFAGVARSWVSTPGITTISAHENTGGTGQMFQPDLLVVAGSDGAFGGLADDFRAQLGFVVGSSQVGSAVDIDRGTNPTRADAVVDSTRVPFLIFGSSGGLERVNFTIDSTGYNAVSSSGSPDVTVMAIKFSGPFRAACDNLAISNSTGVQSFPLGLRPRVVLGMSTLVATEDSVVNGATAAAAGFFTFTAKAARAYTGRHSITATPGTATSLQGDYALATLSDTGGIAQRAIVSSIDESGFALDFTEATVGFMSVLGIEFGPSPALGANQGQVAEAPAARRRDVRFVGGAARHLNIGNVLREIGRFRRAALARIRWRPPPEGLQEPITIGADVEESSGRITGPGAARGRVVGAGAIGRVASAGALRGLVIGPGTEQPDRIDLP
jgi:hypothetical protein